MQPTSGTILALDVGERRVGVAIAAAESLLPKPLLTLQRTSHFWQELTNILTTEKISLIIVGYPRSMSGSTTAQTEEIESFVEELQNYTDVPTSFQDETLTSVKAEEELKSRQPSYIKEEVDALAATYILEDYLKSQNKS